MSQTLNLQEVRPFGSGDAQRCCVLFESRKSGLHGRNSKNLVAKLKQGKKRPRHEERLDDVLDRLIIEAAPKPIPRKRSQYVDESGKPVFRQGATITPKVLTVVDQTSQHSKTKQNRILTTRSNNMPWSEIEPQRGVVPADWIRALVISNSILPFAVSPNERYSAVIPTTGTGDIDNEAVKNNAFWRRMNRIYEENRGKGKSTPKSLLAQIDYGSKLSSQLTYQKSNLKSVVLYPASGDIMRSCRIMIDKDIIDATLYRFIARTEEEAAYLVSLLNAPCLNDAFVESKESGIDFHLHPWRTVPIQHYNQANADHVALANLTVKAEQKIEDWFTTPDFKKLRLAQVGLSSRIRELLGNEGILDDIDHHVRNILPRQAR